MINKSKESSINKISVYKLMPFMLLFVYVFVKKIFDPSYPYSIGILGLMILISFYAFLKSRKGEDGYRFKVILFTAATFITLSIYIYFLIYP